MKKINLKFNIFLKMKNKRYISEILEIGLLSDENILLASLTNLQFFPVPFYSKKREGEDREREAKPGKGRV